MGQQGVRALIKDMLAERYRDADTSTTEFLAADVRVVKWHVFREGTNGGLELKLGPDMASVEAELTRFMVTVGGRVITSVAPRGPKVRELDTALQGTWRQPGQKGKGTGAKGSGHRGSQ